MGMMTESIYHKANGSLQQRSWATKHHRPLESDPAIHGNLPSIQMLRDTRRGKSRLDKSDLNYQSRLYGIIHPVH